MSDSRQILVTGGTGYVGSRLVPALLSRGHVVRVLTRPESAHRVAAGATAVAGDALDAASVAQAVRTGDTVVHLVGTPHPNPSKADEFLRVDLASVRAAVTAASRAAAAHFIYVSVARPAPVMRAYIAARTQGEHAIADTGLTATIIRPWYVLGPGHRWPLLLTPFYAVARFVPMWREGADRLGLVTVAQMVRALVRAVEDPPHVGSRRIVDVSSIRRA